MRAFLLILCLVWPPSLSRAEQILVNSSLGGIYLVDIETLAVQKLTDAPVFFDIAVSPKGDILGVTGNGQLWRVDPDGAHLAIGDLRVFVNALDFDAKGDLFGAGGNAGGNHVFRVSLMDGATEMTGAHPGFVSSGDMVFPPDGGLFATGSPGPAHPDTLFRLAADGVLAAVGPIGFRNVYGLVWSAGHGALIGVTEARELIVIDPATGAGRLLGNLEIAGWGYGAAAMGSGPVISSELGGREAISPDRPRQAGSIWR